MTRIATVVSALELIERVEEPALPEGLEFKDGTAAVSSLVILAAGGLVPTSRGGAVEIAGRIDG